MNVPRRIGLLFLFAVALFALLFGACSTIAPYDQAAYAQVVSLKVDTLDLMSNATDSYSAHAEQVRKLNLSLAKGYEYDRNRPRNEESIKMWQILFVKSASDGASGILPRFFTRWKTKGSLKPAAVADDQENVGEAFDRLIQLESGKIHSAKPN